LKGIVPLEAFTFYEFKENPLSVMTAGFLFWKCDHVIKKVYACFNFSLRVWSLVEIII